MAVQMTVEQFQEFLRIVRKPLPPNNKNFKHCTTRFEGTRSATDENAISGLPSRLSGEGNLWWNGVKNQDDTMSLITNESICASKFRIQPQFSRQQNNDPQTEKRPLGSSFLPFNLPLFYYRR
ncbi:hypothetical protein MTP99_002755 [Tenebrio molitor]|jgi:hypothetical protein|nr:hypothetical protein MTP99_002755 [Tenebrio molitor]